jgi:peptidyl-prolyl cis-trans isomerase B (cyclophilin B)
MSPRALSCVFRLLWVILLSANQARGAAVREIATISTNLGDMEFELFSDVSPRAVANFKYLADTRFYDSTAFHRHIAGFMVQGGDPFTRGTSESGYGPLVQYAGNGGPEYTIPNEPTANPDRAHVRGVISMAKTTQPDSAGSQFFIMFGSDVGLDDLHAPMGRMISGEAVLKSIEDKPKDSGKGNLPNAPIAISSIRIRSEFSADRLSEKILHSPGTYSGLLKGPDRNQDNEENLRVRWNQGAWNGVPYRGPLLNLDKNMDARGSYQITVTRGGAFSARIQYYGRINCFSGAFLQNSLSVPEASFVAKLDPSGPASLRVRIQARKTSKGTTSLMVRLNQIGPGDSDLNDGSAVIAGGELCAPSNLSDRYTVEIAAPVSSFVQTESTPSDPAMAGSGYLTANIRKPSGVAWVQGRLPDNTPFAFSRPVSSEGGRLSLPVYIHDLRPEVEPLRSEFNKVNLSDMYAPNGYFHFNIFRNRFVGVLELPPSPAFGTPKNESGNWLVWIRPGRTVGIPKNQVASYLVPTVSLWTAPVAGAPLSPFAFGSKGLLSVGTVGVGRFQLARTNAAALFEAGAFFPQIRFNPAEGSFQGSFLEASPHSTMRRTFQGVLVEKDGVRRGVGFSLTEGASLPVFLTP